MKQNAIGQCNGVVGWERKRKWERHTLQQCYIANSDTASSYVSSNNREAKKHVHNK